MITASAGAIGIEDPGLEPRPDDELTFEITVREARIALWYYEMVFALESRIAGQGAVLEALQESLERDRAELTRLRAERMSLVVAGVGIGVLATTALTYFAWRVTR